LKRIREALRISQKQFAEQFRTSQAQVSRWEGDAKELTPEVRNWVEVAEAKVTGSASETQPGTGSLLYSYPAPTFRRLWEEAPKRMEHLHARAVLRPSKTEGFADATLEITFQGLRIPRGDSLYLDCLGVLPRLTRVRYKDEDLLQFRLIDASNLSITKFRFRGFEDGSRATWQVKCLPANRAGAV
jgi:transcriptional regulator with XRE-family HTH domain